ncbi:MAG: hypothetical protein FWH22_07175 [Fibromonadales bacterium]|nr:hypothetical protein [Fibromonadales bacterium]
MRYLLFISIFAALIGCKPEEYEPLVILGHGWDASAKITTDTTSAFKANDVIVIQLDNGNKPFKVSEVELRIYQGETDRILFKRAQSVRDKDAKAVVKGPDFKPLTAREILRTSTPGTYRIAFAAGDSIIAEKRMELVR